MRADTALLLAALLGCSGEDWRNADLQLDIAGSGVIDTDVVRVCAKGYRPHESSVGAGAVGFPGLVPERPVEVIVDALVPAAEGPSTLRWGRAGPALLSPEEPWATVDFAPCAGEGCGACTGRAGSGANTDESWLLAIRFLD